MLRSLITLLLISTSFYTVKAQVLPYDMSQYKLVDYKRQSLDTKINLDGYNNKINKKTRTNSVFDASLSGTYSNYSNSRKVQSNYLVSLGFQPHYSKDYNNNLEKVTKIDFLTRLWFSGVRRYYYKENRYFGLNISTRLNNIYTKKSYPIQTTTIDKRLFENMSIEIQHGHGRIENISESWKAYRLYKEIEKQGLLNNQLISVADINELADLLAILGNRRYYDGRLKRIEDLTLISEHLKNKGLDNSIALFTTVNDMFQYGINTYRQSGYRLTYGTALEQTINIRKLNSINFTNNYQGGNLFVRYDKYKVINEKWQLNYGAEISFGLTDIRTNLYFIEPDAFVSIGYYPNSRTTLKSKISSAYYGLINQTNSDTNENVSFLWTTDLYYYLSPKIRIDARFTLRKANTILIEYSAIKYNVGLNYAIF